LAGRTIRYAEDDLENQRRSNAPHTDFGYPMSRRDSTFSIHSVRSLRAGGRTIDPSLTLPITYRTVSFNITSTQERAAAEAKQAKDKANGGQYRHQYFMGQL
jgi:sodium/potassium-transporting ATPase subunit alpha